MKKIVKSVVAELITAAFVLSALPFAGFADFPAKRAGAVKTGTLKRGDTLYYGSYPQSRVDDVGILRRLDSGSYEWQSFRWMSGTKAFGSMVAGDWGTYCDVTLDGVMYRGVRFSRYRPGSTYYDSSDEWSDQDDNGYFINTTYWFRYEPIEWIVLDPVEGLVLSRMVLDSQAFNNNKYGADKYSYSDPYGANYCSDWFMSSIRSWLNDDFLNTAFTASEAAAIPETHLETKSTYSSQYDSRDSDDKIFLLSYWDVINPDYGFSADKRDNDTARQAKATEYAKCCGCELLYDNASWWLRSPFAAAGACYVWNNGGAADDFMYYIVTGGTDVGVRAAFKLYPGSGSSQPAQEVAYGDLDGDGVVTAADARLALRIAVKLETADEIKMKAADVDGADGVTAADARLILRFAVKLETAFPASRS